MTFKHVDTSHGKVQSDAITTEDGRHLVALQSGGTLRLKPAFLDKVSKFELMSFIEDLPTPTRCANGDMSIKCSSWIHGENMRDTMLTMWLEAK